MDIMTIRNDTSDIAVAIRNKVGELQRAVENDTDYDAYVRLDDIIVYTHQVEEISGALKCVALAMMKQRWDDGLIPLTESGRYEHNFYNYAAAKTGNAGSTVRNWIDAGKTWLDGLPLGIPDVVDLYDRDGNPTGETVTTNPFALSRSKLVLTKAAAKDGRLADNKVALGQLFNEEVGIHTVLSTLNDDGNEPVTYGGLKLWFDGPYLIAQDGFSDPEIVAEFYVEGSDVVEQAVKYIASACHIRGT